MTSNQLGELIEAFANYYWSVSAEFVFTKIMEWHPEVTMKQIVRVVKQSNAAPFKYHFGLLKDELEELEITAEHLYAVDDESFERFLAARIDGPYCECDEATLLRMNTGIDKLGLPEADAILDFGKNVLQLNDSWADQLLHDCSFQQANALCEGKSWVILALKLEAYGKIHFKTMEQVKQFRDLGNQLYQVLPNPVLKGWKPSELKDCPSLLDDIPERVEDIPDYRQEMQTFLEQLGGKEQLKSALFQKATNRPPRRNDPCPCGSGKKYKHCCGKNGALTE